MCEAAFCQVEKGLSVEFPHDVLQDEGGLGFKCSFFCAYEDAATRKGTLKKEVEEVVSFRDKLADVEKGLEDAQKETKVLEHQNNDLSEKVFGVRCEGVWDSDYSEGEALCC
ncbi:hypothetical protein P8452_18752 [Trifolium repens]|nr:hypothetical protein P8452_18752 [Trifolium repens]